MKTKTYLLKLLGMLLSLVMIFGLMSISAFAADLPFTDVKTSSWYYDDVKTAYEGDLINGKTKTTFDPDANLTYAEAVKLAACMNQKSTTGSVTLQNGCPWYQTYVDYCVQNKIISKSYSWNSNATRAGYMEIFAKALPDYLLSEKNVVADGAIPDVPMTHSQATSIYKLYRAGILQGVDKNFSCNPNANIKRCEVAAILTRMMNADKRLSFTIGNYQNTDFSITVSPKDTTVMHGNPAKFSVQVSGGSTPYTYQWFCNGDLLKNNVSVEGATSYELTVYPGAYENSDVFYCTIIDADGNLLTSNGAKLSVATESEELKIVSQPQSINASIGDTAKFEITVFGGTAPYKFNWQSKGDSDSWVSFSDTVISVPGSNNILNLLVNEKVNKNIRCVVTDSAGKSVTSNTANITINSDSLVITTQPQSISAADGSKVKLTVAVSGGTAPYTYNWQYYNTERSTIQTRGWKDISANNILAKSDGAGTLTVTALKDKWTVQYDIHCVVTDAAGNSVASDKVRVSIKEDNSLKITTQPQSVSVDEGDVFELKVEVSGGVLPYTGIWQYKDNSGNWVSVPASVIYSSNEWITYSAAAYKGEWMTNGEIRCLITDTQGNTVTSNSIKITLKSINPKVTFK